MRDKIIVALDTDAHSALQIARSLQGHVSWLKVGMTLFYSEGPEIVGRLREMGFDIFLDLKLHDIPHQVEGAARSVASLGAKMLTVHAAGGAEMMAAAVKGACEGSKECGADTPDILAVTVLTSMGEEDLASVGVAVAPSDQVAALTRLARRSGVQGVVCSPHEAESARVTMGRDALVVTPGVRPAWSEKGDQSRVSTPLEALEAGASHLVIGRPITQSGEPAAAVERILAEGDDGND